MASDRRAGMRTAALMAGAMLGTASPCAAQPTAAQALRAHARMTSIGPDPCRPGAGEHEEIVVCGRRESPYALPGYDPPVAGDGLPSGMAMETAIGTAQGLSAFCHARGEACTKPLPVISAGPGVKGGVRIGQD